MPTSNESNLNLDKILQEEAQRAKRKKRKRMLIQKPIMTADVESACLNVAQQFLNREKWKRWGMDTIRAQGAAILLEGPPGTGKTVIARWLARLLRRGFKEISLANIGGGDPGESEKGIDKVFDEAHDHKDVTLFFDECDILLRNRDQIAGDGLTWMVSTTERLMVRIENYAGICILATNHAKDLDPALNRRLLACVHVSRPDLIRRIKLWRQKIPKKYPVQLTRSQIATIAKVDLSGAEIENAIINAASDAMRRGTKPTYQTLTRFANAEQELSTED